MSADYYDRNGNPITIEEWTTLFADKDYRLLKKSKHKEGKKEFILSTVWLGINHSFNDGIETFETMAFELKPPSWNSVIGEVNFDDLACRRYGTESDAISDHKSTIVTGEK